MEPNELRIGNYYLYKGSEIKFDISDFKEIDHNLLELLKPIPLTKYCLRISSVNKEITATPIK